MGGVGLVPADLISDSAPEKKDSANCPKSRKAVSKQSLKSSEIAP
ncbi:hypothetical protein MBEBAB_0074 [Brevundimonas abyssalis TAR-001]|uniref:Uncharacterized protein n=1 Tax=Brevundimonas abyssalis TAR-001 TaxID=1391729 RepID=A0A8E0N7U1_9CAUL|nr:hypothetical protein MBEBAB_0074 [Brevundimonas abyssalis TAR-001]